MSENKETPEYMRERLIQEEQRKDSPMVVFKDGMDRAAGGSLSELMRGLGWKGTLIIVLVLVVAIIVMPGFF